MTNSIPKNQKLYSQVKSEAKKKFKTWPSAYGSAWLVKEYKNRGGKYTTKKSSTNSNTTSNLSRWFLEKWINICTKPYTKCGRTSLSPSNWTKKYPYCRPSKRISKETPKTVHELTKTEIKRRCSRKRRSPLKKMS